MCNRAKVLNKLFIFRSALKVVEEYFPQLLEEQEFLAVPKQWNKILALLPSKIRDSLNEEWEEHPEMSSLDRWRRIRTEMKVGG